MPQRHLVSPRAVVSRRPAVPSWVVAAVITGAAGILGLGPVPTEAGDTRLHAVVEDYYEEFLRLNPVLATFNGDHRYDDLFTINIAPEHLERSRAVEERYLRAIETLDPDTLDDEDRLTWEIFRRNRKEALEGFRYPEHLLPVSQFFSVPNFFALLGSGRSVQPFATVQDYDNWLARMRRFPDWVDQAIVNMREGMARGVVQPRVVMEKVLPQLEAHVVDDVEQSMFYQPLRAWPADASDADRQRLEKAYRATIAEAIIPAYRRLHDFIRDAYLDGARDTVGWSDLPDGREWYAFLVRQRTTTDLAPEAIHELGLREVERLTAEMQRVRAQYADVLGAAPGFEDEDDMLEAYRSLKSRVRERVGRLFVDFPAADFEIRPVEAFRARSAAGASYMAGSPDGTRPGVFYVNTRNARGRSRRGVEALYLHEAVPGHHFQISIQRELAELPRFRRFGGFTAYSEGWGLYAETLGKELGLYEDPEQYLGALGSELFRAKRLVVDTGLHVKGWSRERAIEYMNGNVAEVERYIVLPAQALAYKVGQLAISDLRARAEARLGDRFDVRAFHHEVLRDGALPLDVLEDKIERWIASVEGEQAARR